MPHKWQDKEFKSENLVLYSAEANTRARQLANVSYRLVLNLSESEEEGFEGALRTSFTLREKPTKESPLFLDFQGQEISRVKINERYATPDQIKFDRHRIYLPSELLQTAEASQDVSNTVQLEFKNSYVSNSAGLHYYRDPKD